MYNKNKMGTNIYKSLPSYHREQDELENDRLLEKFAQVLGGGLDLVNEGLDDVIRFTQVNNCPEDRLKYLALSMGADWIRRIPSKYHRKVVSLLITLYKSKGTIDTLKFIASELSGFEAIIHEGVLDDDMVNSNDLNKRKVTVTISLVGVEDENMQEEANTILYVMDKFTPVQCKAYLVVSYCTDETRDVMEQMSYEDFYTIFEDFMEEILVKSNIVEEWVDTFKQEFDEVKYVLRYKPLYDNLLNNVKYYLNRRFMTEHGDSGFKKDLKLLNNINTNKEENNINFLNPHSKSNSIEGYYSVGTFGKSNIEFINKPYDFEGVDYSKLSSPQLSTFDLIRYRKQELDEYWDNLDTFLGTKKAKNIKESVTSNIRVEANENKNFNNKYTNDEYIVLKCKEERSFKKDIKTMSLTSFETRTNTSNHYLTTLMWWDKVTRLVVEGVYGE